MYMNFYFVAPCISSSTSTDAQIKANGGSYGKAVLMSGDDNLKEQFESKGFNFFLHKPVTKPQFKEFAAKL